MSQKQYKPLLTPTDIIIGYNSPHPFTAKNTFGVYV